MSAGVGASLGGSTGLGVGAGATVGGQNGTGLGVGITLGNAGSGDGTDPTGGLPGMGQGTGIGTTGAASNTGTGRQRGRSANTAVTPATIESLNAEPYNPYTDNSQYVGFYANDEDGAVRGLESRSLVEQRRCTTRVCLRRAAHTHR